jgi:hypothetical protein
MIGIRYSLHEKFILEFLPRRGFESPHISKASERIVDHCGVWSRWWTSGSRSESWICKETSFTDVWQRIISIQLRLGIQPDNPDQPHIFNLLFEWPSSIFSSILHDFRWLPLINDTSKCFKKQLSYFKDSWDSLITKRRRTLRWRRCWCSTGENHSGFLPSMKNRMSGRMMPISHDNANVLWPETATATETETETATIAMWSVHTQFETATPLNRSLSIIGCTTRIRYLANFLPWLDLWMNRSSSIVAKLTHFAIVGSIHFL